MTGQGIAHTHDRRVCWDCNGVGIVGGAVSLRIVERALILIGWRFLEHRGRMVCPQCAAKRRAERRIDLGQELG
jgi:hypothetical protein